MERYNPNWHNEHIFNSKKFARQVIKIGNESNGTTSLVTIHVEPCALCVALLAEVIYPKSSMEGLILEMTKIADGPPSPPSKA